MVQAATPGDRNRIAAEGGTVTNNNPGYTQVNQHIKDRPNQPGRSRRQAAFDLVQ
jgi:hypothetical protein